MRNPISLRGGAERYDVTDKTIRRWIASGLLVGYRMGPRLVYVDADELDALAQRIIPATDHSDENAA